MNWYTFFYFAAISENVSHALGWLLFLATVASVIGMLMMLLSKLDSEFNDDDSEGTRLRDIYASGKRLLRYSIPSLLAFTLLSVLIPSKRDMLLIAAGGAIGNFVSTNADARQLPADVVKWMHTELKAATDEVSPVVKSQKKKLEALDKEELVKQLLAVQDSTK